MVFDSLSIGTTLPIESNASQKRAKLAFVMPLTERLNNARHAFHRRTAAECGFAGYGLRREEIIDRLRAFRLESPFCCG